MPTLSAFLVALVLLPAMLAAALTWYAALSVDSDLADAEGLHTDP